MSGHCATSIADSARIRAYVQWPFYAKILEAWLPLPFPPPLKQVPLNSLQLGGYGMGEEL